MAAIFRKIIKYCFYLTLFTPLFVSGDFVFPYVFPKTALFQILVEIAFAFWILLMAVDRQYRLPKFTGLMKTIAFWLVILFFTSLLGVNFYHSLWSTYERMTGLVTLLHYLAYFLILVSVLKTEKDWLRIFDVSVIASLVVGLIAVFQKTGALMSPAGGRIASSFGNPSFLAAYLLFNIFFIIFLLYKKYSQPGWRFYYLAALLFNLLILFWTGTRGALLALLIGIFIFLLLFLFASQKHLPELKPETVRKLKIGAVFILVLFGIIFSFALAVHYTPVHLITERSPSATTKIVVFTKDLIGAVTTAQTRVMAWQMSMQGWKERFLFGWGWENYNVVFNKFYNPYLFPTETWFDRAHNIFFDTVVTSGLVGLLSYLAIFMAVFRILWKGYFQNKINFFTAALFGALFIVYFLQNFFVFDMLHGYLMFFLVLGFVGFVELSMLGIQPAAANEKNKKQIPSFLKISTAVFLILALYFFNIRPGLAGYYTIKALKIAAQQSQSSFYKQDKVFQAFERAFRYGTFGQWENSLRLGEYALDLASYAKDRVFEDDMKKVFNFAIQEIDKAVRSNSTDARYVTMLGALYLNGVQYDSSRIYLAEKTFTAALELSPTKQDTLFALSQTKMMLNKKEEAGYLLRRAVELNPKAGLSHWTLGLYYILIGDKETGRVSIEKAKQAGYGLNPERIKKLAGLYEKINAYEEIVPLYEEGIKMEPGKADWHAALAATYAKLGQKEKAIEEVNEAVRLNPSLKAEADTFLKELKPR